MIDQWIASILLFNFKLKHVPGKDHTLADGLSKRPQNQEDFLDDEDVEEWLDQACAFGMECIDRQLLMPSKTIDNSKPGTIPIQGITKTGMRITSLGTFVQMLITGRLKIPWSDKAKACDQKMKNIDNFLQAPDQLTNLPQQEFRRFVHADRNKIVLHVYTKFHFINPVLIAAGAVRIIGVDYTSWLKLEMQCTK